MLKKAVTNSFDQDVNILRTEKTEHTTIWRYYCHQETKT
jgi:hypothetical protein